MKFELIRSLQNLEWYGKIPCLPINYNSTEGKRFVGEETDSWLLLEDFVPEMDSNIHGDRSSHWTMNRYRMQRRHNFLLVILGR